MNETVNQIDDAATVIVSITTGQYTRSELSAIKGACQSRERVLTYQAGHQLRPGDRVKFTSGRPRYLIGEFATVEKVMQTYVSLKLDRDCGKFRAFSPIRTPMSMIEKVSEVES